MAKKVTDESTDLSTSDALLKKIAKKMGVNPNLLKHLIEIEESKVHLERRRGVVDTLRKNIEEFETGGTR